MIETGNSKANKNVQLDLQRTLLQNELKCHKTGTKVRGKTRKIVFQPFLQQCLKTSCMVLLPVLPESRLN